MVNDKDYFFWCDDCKCFVEHNHRGQQWNTVSFMPREALKAILAGKLPPKPPKENQE